MFYEVHILHVNNLFIFANKLVEWNFIIVNFVSKVYMSTTNF